MDRRRFIGTCAAGLFAAQTFVDADAQPAGKVYRIGFLGGLGPTAPQASQLFDAFFQGLRELGYIDGRNFVFEGRYYGDRPDRLPALASELVQLKVDVIVTGAPPAPESAQRATSTIPIVMAIHPDPVASGLAVSLARPGRNVTGLSTLTAELAGKRLQLLKEAVPGISRVAVLLDPTYPTAARDLRQAQVAARSMSLQLQVVEARAADDFEAAFSTMARNRADALISIGGNLHFTHRARIVELAARSRLPSIYPVKQYAEAGGLMAYGSDIRESFRRAAAYVDKILKGANPGDLPVEQATKFQLTINLKTAAALGLRIAQPLLHRADDLIE